MQSEKIGLLENAVFDERILMFVAVLSVLFAIIFWVGLKLVAWAKRRKTAAVVFGAAAQMLLPDPNVEKTLKIIQESKKKQVKQQQNGEPETIDDQVSINVQENNNEQAT